MNHCYNFVSMFFTITKCRCFIEIKRLFSKMAWRAAIRLAKKGDTRNQTLTEISRVCDRIFLVYLEARVLFCSDQNNALSFRVRALFRELQMSSGKPDWIIFFRIESIDSRANLKKKKNLICNYVHKLELCKSNTFNSGENIPIWTKKNQAQSVSGFL